MSRASTFLLGVAVGAGMMYILDPMAGRRRRALARDQVADWSNEVGDYARKSAANLTSRARHMAKEARSMVHA